MRKWWETPTSVAGNGGKPSTPLARQWFAPGPVPPSISLVGTASDTSAGAPSAREFKWELLALGSPKCRPSLWADATAIQSAPTGRADLDRISHPGPGLTLNRHELQEAQQVSGIQRCFARSAHRILRKWVRFYAGGQADNRRHPFDRWHSRAACKRVARETKALRYRIRIPIHPVRTPHLPRGSVRFGRCHALPDCRCHQQAAMVDKASAITRLKQIFFGTMTSCHRAERARVAAASLWQLRYSPLPPNGA